MNMTKAYKVKLQINGQARSQVLSFAGAKYIFRGQDFCFYHIFKINFLVHNTIWGAQKVFGGNCPRIPLRGYGPVMDHEITKQ